MTYTVGEMAKILNVPTSTLRYYDKEGLIPFVERSESGIRIFKDSDYEWLQVIGCLKKAGLPLKDIKRFIEMVQAGDSTISERLQMFQNQRELVKAQIQELEETLKFVNYKCWYYEQAQEAGTTEIFDNITLDCLPEEYREVKRNLQKISR